VDDAAKQAQVTKAARTLQFIGYVGSAIDIGLTLKSLIENFQQNDDAYIGDSIMLTGFILTALGGTAVAAPLAVLLGLSAAWVTGIGLLILLAGYLVKRYVFPEDTHFEIWLANGPFACGKHSHPHFRYSRQVGIITVHDKDGQPAPKTCTVHIYDNNALYVDATGNLVKMVPESSRQGIGPSPITKYDKFKLDQTGKVYLNAGKHPGVDKDTLIGTIGQPYRPHPLLQTQTAQSAERFDGHTPGEDPAQYLRKGKILNVVPAGIPVVGHAAAFGAYLYDAKKHYRFALWCENPKEAHSALMDALYRPTITSKTVRLNPDAEEIRLHIHTPFLLPNSMLYLEFRAEQTCMGRLVEENLPPIEYTLDSEKSGGHHYTPKEREEKINEFENSLEDPLGHALNGPNTILAKHRMERPASLKELEDGPNRFTIRLENRRSIKCELKVRIDLFGKQETCLPCEPLFCEGDIDTDDHGQRWVKFKNKFELLPARYVQNSNK
jgi:hypothetical protein